MGAASLISYLFAHPVLLAIVVVVALVALVAWLIVPPSWKGLDSNDLGDGGSFWDRLLGRRSGRFWWW